VPRIRDTDVSRHKLHMTDYLTEEPPQGLPIEESSLIACCRAVPIYDLSVCRCLEYSKHPDVPNRLGTIVSPARRKTAVLARCLSHWRTKSKMHRSFRIEQKAIKEEPKAVLPLLLLLLLLPLKLRM
jgi:hypothetical protein